MTAVLRLWLVATVIGLTILAVWAFAPVLIFVVLLLVALGVLAAAMIDFAHKLPGRIARIRAALARFAAGLAALARRLGARRGRR
jgi:hypothetical protein